MNSFFTNKMAAEGFTRVAHPNTISVEAGFQPASEGGIPAPGHLVWLAWPIACLLGASLLTGCLSRPSLTKQSFTFSAPPAAATPAGKSDRVLGIRKVNLAAPFDSQSFVYRTGEFSYEKDPYAEFLAPPAESLGTPIRDYFRKTGVFRSVTEPGSALRPNTLVEIYVDQLYGDFRDHAHPTGVLAARLIFFDAPHGVPAKIVLQKEYDLRVPLRARTAAALVQGWNEALGQLIKEAAAEFAKSRAEPGHPPEPKKG